MVLAQINPLVGDISGNLQLMTEATTRARDQFHADVIVFPELTLLGYPPEDLLLRNSVIDQVDQALATLCQFTSGIDIIAGFPYRTNNKLFNAAGLIRDGKLQAVYFKQRLPNYGVFDELRYFTAGNAPCIIEIRNVPVALSLCEDLWGPEPARQATDAGARMIINLNASPFRHDKGQARLQVCRDRVRENGIPIAYVNQVGGQDELVFDGGSFIMNREGDVTCKAEDIEETLLVADFSIQDDDLIPVPGHIAPTRSIEATVYQAIVVGIRDYVRKNHFPGVVIGLSGGIDSALTLALAVDALGADRVAGVLMPSRYTSEMSIEDARAEADILGASHQTISIEPVFSAFLASLDPTFAGCPRDTTEENIQARCRGTILMAIANKQGRIVLTTGNKSELSVGYATLYGDMAGGFAPIKDCAKTLVYRLARYRNAINHCIPQRVLQRAPSAELAPDQTDQDSLPPYEVLDPILERFIENGESASTISAAGFDHDTVTRVVTMVIRNEYKRRQAPPGVRISRVAFGRDRRYPITSGWMGEA